VKLVADGEDNQRPAGEVNAFQASQADKTRNAVSPLSGLIPPELRKMFCVGNFADADWNQGRSKRFIGMRSDVPRLAIFHGIGTGVFAFILAALCSKGLNDPSARLVLIAVFSLWTAVGSGITAFLMLNVEDRKQSPSSRR